MSKTVRHIINGVSGALLAACLVLAYMSGVSCRAPLKCTGLNVVIADSSMNRFVSKADVKKFLDKEYGEYVGMLLDSIDLAKVEKIIDGRSAVNKSEAYTTRDGMLNVKVTQRTPVVRFQKSDGGFYADAEGFLFPLQSSYASRVQVIDGDIPLKANSGYKGEITDEKERAWLEKVIDLVNYMENSRTWKDKIVQITVCDGGELIMVPREGKERFHFGQPDEIQEKFRKMEKYYTAVVPAKGEKEYSVVNLEYDGQIVCR
jgi:cell division protein FtsQ